MERKNITLELAGQEFQISTSENTEYVLALSAKADARIEKLREAHPNMNLTKCILLALLNAEDELGKARENYESLDSKLTRLREISTASASEYSQRRQGYKRPADVQ